MLLGCSMKCSRLPGNPERAQKNSQDIPGDPRRAQDLLTSCWKLGMFRKCNPHTCSAPRKAQELPGALRKQHRLPRSPERAEEFPGQPRRPQERAGAPKVHFLLKHEYFTSRTCDPHMFVALCGIMLGACIAGKVQPSYTFLRFWNSRNKEADEPHEADEPETVSATAAQAPLPHALGLSMTVVSKLPQNT